MFTVYLHVVAIVFSKNYFDGLEFERNRQFLDALQTELVAAQRGSFGSKMRQSLPYVQPQYANNTE